MTNKEFLQQVASANIEIREDNYWEPLLRENLCLLKGFIVQGDYGFILVKGTHKKRAHGKLKVSDKAKDYYRVGVLKSGMHTAVLKEINSTCECFSKR